MQAQASQSTSPIFADQMPPDNEKVHLLTIESPHLQWWLIDPIASKENLI